MYTRLRRSLRTTDELEEALPGGAELMVASVRVYGDDIVAGAPAIRARGDGWHNRLTEPPLQSRGAALASG